MAEPLLNGEQEFEWALTRVLKRKSALIGKLTVEARREAMKALIVETGIKDKLVEEPNCPRVAWKTWYNTVYHRGAS